MGKSRQHRHVQLMVTVLFGITAGITFFGCWLLLRLVFPPDAIRSNYCSTSSEVYAVLLSNAPQWVSEMDGSSGLKDSIPFDVMGQSFIAHSYRDGVSVSPALIYVILGTNLDDLRGSDGLFYLVADRELPEFWLNNYWVTRLSDRIYCYQIRGF